MTPCFICGTGIDELRIDPRDGKTRPCFVCEEIINETVQEMDKDSIISEIRD